MTTPIQQEGYVMLYTPDYHYLAGKHFANGQITGDARLAFRPTSSTSQAKAATNASRTSASATITKFPTGPIANATTEGGVCTDWYNASTGAYITTTGDCSTSEVDFGPPDPIFPGYGDGNFEGPSEYGGGGTGTTGTLSAITVVVIPPDKPVNNVREFLKCFDAKQAATLTIYVKQAVAGTRDTYSGTDVGHAFISLSQNGITRVFGFYPTSDATIIMPVTSVFGDDSRHGYDVSITTTIPPASLNNILNYTYGYTSNQYSLQNNNCINYSIGIGAQLGWGLPDTKGVWLGVFEGSNPGDFGEDMRTMTLPSGVYRNLTGGTAPSNLGGC